MTKNHHFQNHKSLKNLRANIQIKLKLNIESKEKFKLCPKFCVPEYSKKLIFHPIFLTVILLLSSCVNSTTEGVVNYKDPLPQNQFNHYYYRPNSRFYSDPYVYYRVPNSENYPYYYHDSDNYYSVPTYYSISEEERERSAGAADDKQ